MAKPPPLSRITVDDAVGRYVESLERRVARSELSPATLSAYRRDLLEFVDLMHPDVVLDDIEPDDLDQALTLIAKAPDLRYTKGAKLAPGGGTAPNRDGRSKAESRHAASAPEDGRI